MPGYLPPLFAAASIVLTYLFCIRPMRRGSCHLRASAPASAPGSSARLADELELARTELELLRLRQARRVGVESAPTTTNRAG